MPARQLTPNEVTISGNPKISEQGFIVYESPRNGNSNIYLYDIKDHKEIQLTYPEESGSAWMPDIEGNLITWTSFVNGIDNVEYCIYEPSNPDACAVQKIIPDTPYGSDVRQWKSKIAHGRIAYVDKAGYTPSVTYSADIRLFDTRTGLDELIIANQLITWISFDKNDLVWTDEFDTDATRLFYCNITENCRRELLVFDEAENIYPDISNGWLTYTKFWTDDESPYFEGTTTDIAVMDLKNPNLQEINLTHSPSPQHQSTMGKQVLTYSTTNGLTLRCLPVKIMNPQHNASGSPSVEIKYFLGEDGLTRILLDRDRLTKFKRQDAGYHTFTLDNLTPGKHLIQIEWQGVSEEFQDEIIYTVK